MRSYNQSYPLVSRLLNASGREVMFYCSWPVGTSHTCGWPLQYQLRSKHCTAMKQYHDVQDNWDSIETIVEYWSRGSMLCHRDALGRCSPDNFDPPPNVTQHLTPPTRPPPPNQKVLGNLFIWGRAAAKLSTAHAT